jgi:hypothetical protein
MKKTSRQIAFIFFMMSLLVAGSLQAAVPSSIGHPVAGKGKPLAYSRSLKIADVEQYLGRKMSFGEKMAFRLNKKKTTEIYAQMGDGRGPIMGLAVWAFVLSFLLGPVGIVLSLMALHRFKKEHNKRGRGFAIAGLIIGIITTISWILVIF